MHFSRYSLNGEFVGLEEVNGNMFHLCNVSSSEADAAWVFGTRYTIIGPLKLSNFGAYKEQFKLMLTSLMVVGNGFFLLMISNS